MAGWALCNQAAAHLGLWERNTGTLRRLDTRAKIATRGVVQHNVQRGITNKGAVVANHKRVANNAQYIDLGQCSSSGVIVHPGHIHL